MSRPVLADLVLVQVQSLAVDESGAQARDLVPALEGDVVDTVARRSQRVVLTGVLSGPSAADDLEQLRIAFRDARPLPFTADVAEATHLSSVVLEGLVAREIAGSPQRVDYALLLREHVPAPATEQRAPVPPPGPQDTATADEARAGVESQVAEVAAQRGTLEVRVELAAGAESAEAYAGIVVRVEASEGAQGEAATYSAVGTEQDGGVYRFGDVPAGDYRIRVELR